MGAKFDREKWLCTDAYHSTPESTFAVNEKNEEFARSADDLLIPNLTFNMGNLISKRNYIDNIYGQFTGPCLVVGAGPSAYSEIENIRKLKEKGYAVIVVDRVFNFLKRNGVKPDLTVSEDPQSTVTDFYTEFREGDIASLSIFCHPSVLYYVGQSRYFYHGQMIPPVHSSLMAAVYRQFGYRLASVRPGRVVTASAVDIATWMGFDVIITVGNELSFGSVEEMQSYLCDKNQEPIMCGDRVTFSVFHEAAGTLAARRAQHDGDVRYIDASPGGITEYWERKTLTEILELTTVKEEQVKADDVEKNTDAGTACIAGNVGDQLQ